MSAESINMRINACRICLHTQYTESVSFDDGGGWIEMFEFCFGLTVSPEDMPRKLCGVCLQKMKEFSELKNQSHKSDKLWKTIVLTGPMCNLETSNTDDLLIPVKEENFQSELDASDGGSIHYEFKEDFILKEENDIADKLLGDVESHKRVRKKIKKKCSENKPYKCKYCEKEFKSEKRFKIHLMENKCKAKSKAVKQTPVRFPKSQASFDCGLCEETPKSEGELKEHLNKHNSNIDLLCKLCEYIGRDFADMVIHRYVHQPNQRLKCYSCNKKCNTLQSLQYHYRSVHLKKPGGLCSQCNRVYNGYKSWKNHERSHQTERYICHHCDRRFLYRCDIVEHLTDHGVYRTHVCDVCGNKFKRLRNLEIHISQVHDHKEVSCTHCDKKFKNKFNLKVHLLREERGKKFQCEICSKCFNTAYDLQKHMIWHADERPFACHLCDSAFKVKNHLNIHLRKHTGDMPYKCTVMHCPKAFPSSNQLKVHLAVHSGVRRYKCPYCERTFHNKTNVVTHCAKAHNITGVKVGEQKKK